MDGASVESIFNRVRLEYEIARYVDVLGYKKEGINNFTTNETRGCKI